MSDTDDLYVQKVVCFFPRFLFHDPQRAARRFVMWIEAPGNALLGLADTLGLDDEMMACDQLDVSPPKESLEEVPARARRGRNADAPQRTLSYGGGQRAR